jgi:hypothetical protein
LFAQRDPEGDRGHYTTDVIFFDVVRDDFVVCDNVLDDVGDVDDVGDLDEVGDVDDVSDVDDVGDVVVDDVGVLDVVVDGVDVVDDVIDVVVNDVGVVDVVVNEVGVVDVVVNDVGIVDVVLDGVIVLVVNVAPPSDDLSMVELLIANGVTDLLKNKQINSRPTINFIFSN